MLENIFTPIIKTISTIFLSLSMLTGYQTPTPSPSLGTSFSVIADYTSSLSAGISSIDTEMSVSSLVSGSETLIPGETYGFKLGGREYVIGTISTTTSNKVVMMTRGLSRKTATTTISSYAYTWGRGTSVEITDAPILIDINNKITGNAGFDTPIKYVSTISTSTIASNRNYLATAGLVADVAFNGAGVINAGTNAKGVVQIATQVQARSSTATGSSGSLLVLPSSMATSTYNTATASSTVLMTGYTGKLDVNFLPSGVALTGSANTFTAANTFSTSTIATTTIGAFPAWEIGKQVKIFTSSGTFTVPSGISKVYVKIVGGGGAGGNNTCNTANQVCGFAGGSSGGYAEGSINVMGTTSIGVTVGTGGSNGSGAGNPGLTSYFSTYLTATGGQGGSNTAGAVGSSAGAAVGGDINITGQPGGQGTGIVLSQTAVGGMGGSTLLGLGGSQAVCPGGNNGTGGTAVGYGSGGGGACSSQSGGQGSAGAGASGIVIITW